MLPPDPLSTSGGRYFMKILVNNINKKGCWHTVCPTLAKKKKKLKNKKWSGWLTKEGLCLRVINEVYPPLKRNHSLTSYFTLKHKEKSLSALRDNLANCYWHEQYIIRPHGPSGSCSASADSPAPSPRRAYQKLGWEFFSPEIPLLWGSACGLLGRWNLPNRCSCYGVLRPLTMLLFTVSSRAIWTLN